MFCDFGISFFGIDFREILMWELFIFGDCEKLKMFIMEGSNSKVFVGVWGVLNCIELVIGIICIYED